MKIKAWVFLLCYSLSGCDTPTVQAEKEIVRDFSHCEEIDSSYKLPKIGEKKQISVAVSVMDESEKELSAVAICEYKASMCSGSFRNDIWHGNQNIQNTTLELSSGHELIFFPHGSCLDLTDYLKKCTSSNACKPEDIFTITVMLPKEFSATIQSQDKERKVARYSQGEDPKEFVARAFPDRKLVPYALLGKTISRDIKELSVTVADIEE